MIISKIYNSLDKIAQDDLISDLIAGLISGLIAGLIAGLALGLIFDLVFGLVFGLIFGLTLGLIFGLTLSLFFGLTLGLIFGLISNLVVILINWSEALPFLTSFPSIFLLILGIIIITETLFWLIPKEKVKSKNLFLHTLKRKGECLLEVLLLFSFITQSYILIRELKKYITQEIINEIIKWIGYIGVGIVTLCLILSVLYLWIKLNSSKYKQNG